MVLVAFGLIHSTYLDLDSFNKWCNTWSMNLNTDKCYFMNFTLIGSNNFVHDYSIGSTVLSPFEMKDLVVYFTPNLNFTVHIKKASR